MIKFCTKRRETSQSQSKMQYLKQKDVPELEYDDWTIAKMK